MRGFSDKGFTLIELLVTISIIAVLSTIAAMTFSGLQQNARNARRQSDLKVIQSALEQYHSDAHYYPQKSAVSFADGSGISNGTKIYLKQIPLDPVTTNTQYCYNPTPVDCTTKCTSYSLYAKLENTTGTLTCGTITDYNHTVSPP